MAISIAAAVTGAAVRRLPPSSSENSSHFPSLQFPPELRNLRSLPKLRRRSLAPIVHCQLGHYFHPQIDTEILYVSENVSSKKQTFSTLEEMLGKYDKPVLVEFYATWCSPCQFMFRVLEQIDSSMADKILIVKIDTDKFPAITSKYEIKALPTFILFKDGKPIDRFEGAMPAAKLIERVDASLLVRE